MSSLNMPSIVVYVFLPNLYAVNFLFSSYCLGWDIQYGVKAVGSGAVLASLLVLAGWQRVFPTRSAATCGLPLVSLSSAAGSHPCPVY